jgi:hypothetical protein
VAETSPTVARDASSGDQWVYYVTNAREIATLGWSSSGGWAGPTILGGKVTTPSSPTVVRDASSGEQQQFVYYQGNDTEIVTWTYLLGGWDNSML